jgi:hypothetical protein
MSIVSDDDIDFVLKPSAVTRGQSVQTAALDDWYDLLREFTLNATHHHHDMQSNLVSATRKPPANINSRLDLVVRHE